MRGISIPATARSAGGEVIRSTHKESLAKHRAKRKTKTSEGAKPMTLGQIAAKARRLHMSYGEFVAKYGI